MALGQGVNRLQNARERLEALLAERIAVLDGSWGVLLQNRGLTEEQWRVSASATTRGT